MAAYVWTGNLLLVYDEGASVELAAPDLAAIRKANDEVFAFVKLTGGVVVSVGQPPKGAQPED
jgi:hypothetical protein